MSIILVLVNFVKIQFADELDEYIENMDKTTKFEEPTAAANAVLKLIMDAKIFGCTAYEAFFDSEFELVSNFFV